MGLIKKIIIHPRFHDTNRLALADIALVERALENLIENALGHTPEKGQVTVEIFAGTDIEIGIPDFGPGIPESELGRIFDRFYQSCHRTGNTHVGLSLAITRKIIELHGKELKAQVQNKTFHMVCLCIRLLRCIKGHICLICSH